jgi:hypothetical protein
MKNLFENISNEILDAIDMSMFEFIKNDEYQKYYTDKSSKEHYRLLTYLSNQFNNEVFLDIGTLKGCSALALSTNQTNNVHSFNLAEQRELSEGINNIEFYIDDIINGKYDSLILKSKLILLDTFHDGSFEIMFYNYIKNLGYVGTLILDDTYLNNDMINFWNQINDEKIDVTNIGHSTGTGVVFLK